MPELSFELKYVAGFLLKSCLCVNYFIVIYSPVFIGKQLYARPYLCLMAL